MMSASIVLASCPVTGTAEVCCGSRPHCGHHWAKAGPEIQSATTNVINSVFFISIPPPRGIPGKSSSDGRQQCCKRRTLPRLLPGHWGVNQPLGGRLFDLLRQPRWDRNRLCSFRPEAATHRSDLPPRDRGSAARDLVGEGQGGPPLAEHLHAEVEHVAEAGGGQVVAGGGNAGPADLLAVLFNRNRSAQRGQEFVLRGLHEDEEAGEVDDARHVRVGELDPASRVVLVHGGGCYHRAPRSSTGFPQPARSLATGFPQGFRCLFEEISPEGPGVRV